ncbi:MAG TPA: FtsK/SpoIIIE domain-containing protein [Actinocrinis sp.]|nr:FtsK/SpoIIIE domain-containing protein [Actinocrinis sp.]
MKLKLSLQRQNHPAVDLLATVDAAARVGDLAGFLVRADPRGRAPGGPVPHPAARPTLRVLAPRAALLDPEATVGDSGLCSGMTVAVASALDGAQAGVRPETAAVLEAVTGPDRGKEFRLPRGTTAVGRDSACGVYLTDTLVSRRHAQIKVGEQIEIVDLGSANGLEIGATTVARALLRRGDRVRLGDTELLVRAFDPNGGAGAAERGGFNRPPRLDPRYAGRELTAPQPPKPPQKTRLPVIPLLLPLLMGVLLYLTTHQASSLLFVLLSPLMTGGYAVEGRVSARKELQAATAEFRTAVAELVDQAREGAAQEGTARRHEHPALGDCVDAVRHGGALLWTRRPGEPGFGELRLGTATLPSRNTVALPADQGFVRALMNELAAAVAPFDRVERVPVVAAPGRDGAIGVAGEREEALGVARGLVAQAVGLHSPAELLIAAFASVQTAPAWDWLKWLPHATPEHGTLERHRFAATAGDATALVSELEELIAGRAAASRPGDGRAKPDLPLVLVVVEDDTPVERSRIVAVAETGWKHGVHVLWIAERPALLPAACRVFAVLDAAGGWLAGFAGSGESIGPLTVESLSARDAVDLALRLAPRVDLAARADDASDLPGSVSLLAIGGQQLTPAPGAVLERWTQSRSILTGPYAPLPRAAGSAKILRKPGTLRAVLGVSAAGAHVLDLRADGPHALVGGTTGAGKSELLQSWIVAMAAAHSPQRVTFLLVDYKGGSAFGDLKDLPHTVGLVTDLDQHLVRRSLVSLGAELHRRERHFAQHHAKDLLELERRGHTDAPPSLVIVVDEFAALAKELPEFVDGVINVAQRGRSLGVHLILATQRPAGVITDNLRANTNLRLALRMADESDSQDVLGVGDAAYFDASVPGRAVSKTGPGRLVPFQVGYAGGWTSREPAPPRILVEELRFGATAPWEPEEQDHVFDQGPTDLRRMVDAIREAHGEAALPAPRRPWLDPLAPVYDLIDRTAIPDGAGDGALVFAVLDDPEHQRQIPVGFRPDVDGNLAVYGTGGSGKSTLLLTMAAAAGRVGTFDPCHVYGLDFGARGLAMLDRLPHVGTIADGGDDELVARLLTWLDELVAARGQRYAAVNAQTITEYRRLSGELTEPRILLFVDGIAAFRQSSEASVERTRLFERFCAVAADGRARGVHVLVTADRASAVPAALASSIQTRVVLRLADENEYSALGAPTGVLRPASPPGRGLMRGSEVQVAILGSSPQTQIQVSYLSALATSMNRAGIAPAQRFRRLPEHVRLAELPARIAGRPVLGLRSSDLEPQDFVPHGSFLVSGPPGAGRTSTLRTLAAALRRWDPETRLYLFSTRASDLASLPLWTETAQNAQDAADLARKLLADAVFSPGLPPAAMFVEGFTEFPGSPADTPLADMARECLANRRLVVGEAESSTITSTTMGIVGLVKSGRVGLALAPNSVDGDTQFRTPFPPRLKRADFPPGRALLVAGGKAAVVQTAWTDGE